jgi:carbonic anhydrase/acetyltransferase-like protein (isoleucine patch superfamily)
MAIYAFEGVEPSIHADAWIAPGAHVIGDARLAAGSSLWFGAVIRADNTPILVGERSNIQEGAMLHSDPGVPLTIGADCTIGHHAVLHGCTLGDRVLVGMGAIILNRAVIGDDCLIGAGALVTEGKIFPPRSLIVGSPARAVRELDATTRAGLLLSAHSYAERQRRFRAALTRLD